jgi:hypothetical protein
MKKQISKVAVVVGTLLVMSAPAFAADDFVPDLSVSIDTLKEQIEKLKDQGSKSCGNEYRGLLPSSGPLRISLFYGYENFGKRTHDIENAKAMAIVLQQKCQGQIQVCGFKVTEKNEMITRLQKTIEGRPVSVHIFTSSLTSYEALNMDVNEKYWDQKKHSKQVKEHFYRELINSDVVFYGGHSRLGAGPGFEGQSYAQIAFNFVFRLPLQPMLKALAAGPSRLKILGLFSCNSNKYYRQDIERVNPSLSLILSHEDIESGEAEQMTIGALNSVLSKKCDREFKDSMISEQVPDHDVMRFYRAR